MPHSLAKAYVNKSSIYDNARPHYPQEAIQFIKNHLDLSSGLPVLDVGSGTGILSRQLAATGMKITGIEPDVAMLAKARNYAAQAQICYSCGCAEQLGVAPYSVAALVCGQSFHWFEPNRTAKEFKRVLATHNPIFLIWNIRSPDCDDFHRAYEKLLNENFARYAETLQIDNMLESRIRSFFRNPIKERHFQNSQKLSASGLIERTMSCSYAAQPGTGEHRKASHALNDLFEKHQQDDVISLKYKTRIVYGHI